MYRVGVLTNKKNIISKNFRTKEEIDDFLLAIDDKEGLKRYRILDIETKEIIETEAGRK